jgi:hypothetical protein
MATGGLTPIRGNDAYVGYGKQSAWGTPVAPTCWPWWLDGSEWGGEVKVASELQGDSSPFKSLMYKTDQYGTVKIAEYARPIGAGYALQGLLGTGSDAYSAPTMSGTLSSSVAAGATSFSTALNLGVTGTLGLNFTPGLASAVYETQTVDLTTKTGTGPFTYSLVTGAKFLYAHNSADVITSASTHLLTRQVTTYDPYTIEFGWGAKGGGPTQVWRLQDAVCTDLKITLEAKKPVKFEHTWYGTLTKLQASASSPTLEGANIVGQAGAPFMFYQGGTTWLLDGANSGNALQLAKVELALKNTTTPDEFITETLTPAYFQLGNIELGVTASAILQGFAQYNEMFYGSKTLATGASDSVAVGYGSLAATLTSDPVNAFIFNVINGGYTAGRPVPKLDGKSMQMPLQMTAVTSKAATNPFSFTLLNSQASAY